MVEVHVGNSRATIEYKGSRLAVDTSLIGSFVYKIDSLFQFIGELEDNDVWWLLAYFNVLNYCRGI
jgi:hypothetical protein